MQVKVFLKKGLEECCRVIFPDVCLHCKGKCFGNFFCETCLSSFELLNISDLKVFPSISCPVLAAFDDIGPINTFFIELKKMVIPVFAKLAASYMVLQYFNFGYSLPDIVIPLSNSGFGVKYTDILTKEVAVLLQRPVKRIFFHVGSTMLQNTFFAKSSSLKGKTMLIILDKLDESKMSRAVSILEKQNFKSVQFLALCQ